MSEGKSDDSAPKKLEKMNSIPTVTEREREMSNSAMEEFEKGNYDACSKILNKLSETRGPDPRVALNIAVVNFYKSKRCKTEEFRKALIDAAAKAQVQVENINGLDDVDQCVFYYNYAILLYYLRQYKSALAVIDKLFQYTEPMEEGLARKVNFLLVELSLCTYQPEKAVGMIVFLEKTLLGNGKSSQSADKDKDEKKEKGSDKDSREGSVDTCTEGYRIRLGQYKARCYMMLKSMKSYKREVKALMNSMGLTSPIVYLKSNSEYLRGNYRKAIKLLNTGPQPGRAVSETGEVLPVMYYNNMAVIHFYLRKHNLGEFYFRKAVQENEQACKEYNISGITKSLSGRPIHTLGMSRHFELAYNLGIQLLHCGKPSAAFESLMDVIQVYAVNPRLWLRLAECCIMHHRANNDEDRQLSKRMEVVKTSIGVGVHRKLILGPGHLGKQELATETAPGMPSMGLEFAALCIRNSLVLLPEDPTEAVVTVTEDGESKPNLEVSVPAPPGNPLKPHEVANLRCSILAAGSYIALCLNDHYVALEYADRLLKQPHLSGAHKYLGHMYQAEAMVALDQIADAITHLNPDNVTDISLSPPETKHDAEKIDRNGDKDLEHNESKGSLYPWIPRDLPRAKAIMQYNLSTAHAIRGEYEKALMHLKNSSQSIGAPLPAQMTFLNIYLELMEGRRKNVRAIIKENFGHITPNRV